MNKRLADLHQKIIAQRSSHKRRHPLIRLAVLGLATIVFITGLILLVIPGPGLLLIIIALALFSLEFHWLSGPLDRLGAKATKPKS